MNAHSTASAILKKIKRHFVSDAEIDFMTDLFNQGPKHQLGKSNIQMDWSQRFPKKDYSGGCAVTFHVNEDMPCNRFANLYYSQDVANKGWECTSSGSAGVLEIVEYVESTLQVNAGLATWASSDEEDIGYTENFSSYRGGLIPVTFEGIMRMPPTKRIQFASECKNWSSREYRKILELSDDQIEQILDISFISV